jgi:hypothetical protein
MRFVVVEIPDNAEADAFVEAVKTGQVIYAVPAGQEEVDGRMVDTVAWKDIPDTWKVPQVYAVPTMFCECPDYKGISVKSSKYGWFVHAKCARPRPSALQHPFNLVEMGQNGGQWVDGRDRRYYMGFRANREPWRHQDEKR